VLGWTAEFIRQPDGPDAGGPWRFTAEQARFVLAWYALDERGRWLYTRGVLRRAKGWGKSPVASALALAELCGPVRFGGWDAHGDPVAVPTNAAWVQLAGVSERQTANTMSLVLAMCAESPIVEQYRLDLGLTRIFAAAGGRLEPITASAPTAEGARPTFVIEDEALALDTPLPTPSGWTTMGAVQPGDQLIGCDGQPTTVLQATPVQYGRRCYAVLFSDGTRVVSSDGHLWRTKVVGSAALPTVRTTGEMFLDADRSVDARGRKLGRKSEQGRRFQVPNCAAFDLPPVDLPLDPYTLGLWLGDGSKGQAYITANNDEIEELVGYIAEGSIEAGITWNRGRAASIRLSERGGFQGAERPSWAKALQSLPCYRDKHIPPAYFRGSRVQREALLQGLMDSDGHVTVLGHCTFAGNARLTADLVVLLRTLGIRTRPIRHGDLRSRVGEGWKVNFLPSTGLQPFRLKRKADRVRPREGRDWCTVVSIEPLDSVPVRCIEVDAGDHLFLAGEGCHVTHNTHHWTESNGGAQLDRVNRRNVGKIPGGTGRVLETTNAHADGEGSVAERSYDAWLAMREGRTRHMKLLYDCREAHSDVDLADEDDLTAGLLEARGDSTHLDLERLRDEVWDLSTPPEDARRFYLNTIAGASDQWLTEPEWAGCADVARVVADRDVITLGFDGSRSRARGVTDATALIGCRVSDGHLFEVDVWEQPSGPAGRDWVVPVTLVDAAVHEAFRRWTVVGFFADPAKWETHIAGWEAKFARQLKVKATREHPIQWWMTGGRATLIVRALEQFHDAVVDGELTHDGGFALTRHVLHARRRPGRSGIQIAKEHPDSPRKIDAAVAAVLAWQARLAAIAAGVGQARRSGVARRIY